MIGIFQSKPFWNGSNSDATVHNVYGPFPLELLLETVYPATRENLILKDGSLVSVFSFGFVIYYLLLFALSVA